MNFPAFVMLNLFQQNKPQSRVILKQVQDDDIGSVRFGDGMLARFGDRARVQFCEENSFRHPELVSG